MESLQGKFLLATPQMPDPRFHEMVIYMCSHNHEGAMGFVVNQPSPFSLGEIYENAHIDPPDGNLPPVYIGGPVETTAAFFLFSAEYHPTSFLDVSLSTRVSGDSRILVDIAAGRGPKDFIFLLGYAGWAPGQLEKELIQNGWLILPASYNDIFHTPYEQKWKKVAERNGINISLYGDIIGNA
jgi:putative transcriptional regulator